MNYEVNYKKTYDENYDITSDEKYDVNYNENYDKNYGENYDENYDENYEENYDQGRFHIEKNVKFPLLVDMRLDFPLIHFCKSINIPIKELLSTFDDSPPPSRGCPYSLFRI